MFLFFVHYLFFANFQIATAKPLLVLMIDGIDRNQVVVRNAVECVVCGQRDVLRAKRSPALSFPGTRYRAHRFRARTLADGMDVVVGVGNVRGRRQLVF